MTWLDNWITQASRLAEPQIDNNAYVRSGNFRQAGALLIQDNHSSPSFEVYVQRCLHDQEHSSIFTVRYATLNAKGP